MITNGNAWTSSEPKITKNVRTHANRSRSPNRRSSATPTSISPTATSVVRSARRGGVWSVRRVRPSAVPRERDGEALEGVCEHRLTVRRLDRTHRLDRHLSGHARLAQHVLVQEQAAGDHRRDGLCVAGHRLLDRFDDRRVRLGEAVALQRTGAGDDDEGGSSGGALDRGDDPPGSAGPSTATLPSRTTPRTSGDVVGAVAGRQVDVDRERAPPRCRRSRRRPDPVRGTSRPRRSRGLVRRWRRARPACRGSRLRGRRRAWRSTWNATPRPNAGTTSPSSLRTNEPVIPCCEGRPAGPDRRERRGRIERERPGPRLDRTRSVREQGGQERPLVGTLLQLRRAGALPGDEDDEPRWRPAFDDPFDRQPRPDLGERALEAEDLGHRRGDAIERDASRDLARALDTPAPANTRGTPVTEDEPIPGQDVRRPSTSVKTGVASGTPSTSGERPSR